MLSQCLNQNVDFGESSQIFQTWFKIETMVLSLPKFVLEIVLTWKINKTGLDLGELDRWWVQVYARAQFSECLRPRDSFGSHPVM